MGTCVYTFDSVTFEACHAEGYSVVPLQQEMAVESWVERPGAAVTGKSLQKMRAALDQPNLQLETFLPWIGVCTVYLRILGRQKIGLIYALSHRCFECKHVKARHAGRAIEGFDGKASGWPPVTALIVERSFDRIVR